MSQYLQWIVLTAVTGSPIGSLFALLLFWFVVDRFTLGVLPDPFRWVMRFRRELAVRHALRTNPHDGRARLELATLLYERRSYQRAMEVLRPCLEKGDDDSSTLFVMGAACVGGGFHQQGEKLLEHLRERDADFRVGEVDLVEGRGRLARGDYQGAKESFERLLHLRKGSVEGRVLLARAMEKLGDDASAALVKDEAWHEYETAPRFQRRKERLWAWRARPSRPLAYVLVILLALFVVGRVVAPGPSSAYSDPALQPP